jgi:hypothetical protein
VGEAVLVEHAAASAAVAVRTIRSLRMPVTLRRNLHQWDAASFRWLKPDLTRGAFHLGSQKGRDLLAALQPFVGIAANQACGGLRRHVVIDDRRIPACRS